MFVPGWLRRRPLAGLGITVLFVMLAVGCTDEGESSTTTTTAAPAPVDACALLTPDEVTNVVGGPPVVVPLEPIDRDGVIVASCRWNRDDGSNASVSLVLSHEAGQGELVASAVESLRTESYRGRVVEDVTLGDAALWVADGPARQLSVFSGDDYLVITLPVGTTKDAAVALATAALDRLDEAR